MTPIPLNDLGRAVESQREVIRAAVEAVLASGWYVLGPQHDAFEHELAAHVGVGYCVAVGSGTDALELALTALAEPERDVVITAANAGGYVSVAARRSGLRLRFADVDPGSLLLDPAAVAPLLDDQVAAVVVTHLYGRTADVAALRTVCDPMGVPVVEDCAQSAGAVRNGKAAGASGLVGTFSFYPTKNLGALGDGGALVTDDAELAARLRELRQYGWSSKYVIDVPGGRNSRLDEVQAAVLRVRLPLLAEGNARRREIIASYRAASSAALEVLPAEGEGHVGHLAVALSDDRDTVRGRLAEVGVRTDVHYPVPDHHQRALRDQHDGRPLPVTEAVAQRLLTVPCFPELTDHEVDYVCGALADL